MYKNYFKDLPENYVENYVIDAKNKRTSIILTIFSLVLSLIVIVPFLFGLKKFEKNFDTKIIIIYYLIFFISLFLYIILHELTHGIAYKIMTHEKLTFGLTLTVAYCGVPNLYINKKTALISLLAPFTLYSIVFSLGIIFSTNFLMYLLFVLLFSIHFGGCIGDLYGTFIILFKYKGKKILLNDTGPKQTFYIESNK